MMKFAARSRAVPATHLDWIRVNGGIFGALFGALFGLLNYAVAHATGLMAFVRLL